MPALKMVEEFEDLNRAIKNLDRSYGGVQRTVHDARGELAEVSKDLRREISRLAARGFVDHDFCEIADHVDRIVESMKEAL